MGKGKQNIFKEILAEIFNRDPRSSRNIKQQAKQNKNRNNNRKETYTKALQIKLLKISDKKEILTAVREKKQKTQNVQREIKQ